MEGDDDENEDKNFKKPPVVVKRKNLKVNLQPGYSQMDWVRLSHSGKRSQSQWPKSAFDRVQIQA